MCVFDFFEYKFVGTIITLQNGKNSVTEGCVREEVSVCPHGTYLFIIHRVVKRGVLEFIRPCGIKKWILLGESRQEFLGFFALHKTEMPLVNVVKDV